MKRNLKRRYVNILSSKVNYTYTSDEHSPLKAAKHLPTCSRHSQIEFMNIKDKLHHRPPYLLIQKLVSSTPAELIASSKFTGDEFFLQGHFPGTPVVPGAMMQEMTTQAAGLLITLHHSPVPDYHSETTKGWALGVLRAVHMAKYKSFARPMDELTISVNLLDQIEGAFRFSGRIECQGKKIMMNEFTLVNISEEKLKGMF